VAVLVGEIQLAELQLVGVVMAAVEQMFLELLEL
jgi:hypothetical protein